jgi:hypothetical protein
MWDPTKKCLDKRNEMCYSLNMESHDTVGPHKRVDPRKRHKVDVGPHIERLMAVAEARGYTVPDVVRFCIEKVLPEFEKRIPPPGGLKEGPNV